MKKHSLQERTKEYIDECNIIHNYKYSYINIDLTKLKIDISCPIHGIFTQRKYSHKNLRQGCKKCAAVLRGEKNRYNTEEFIVKSKKAQKDIYDYKYVKYINNHTEVDISCSIHGIFKQQPRVHLSGSGCPKCGIIKTNVANSHKLVNFIETSNKVHDYKYSYSFVDYINSQTKVKIFCFKHGIFEQVPNLHIHQKQGCPKCYGFNKTTEEFIEQAKAIHGDKCNYSEVEYTNSNTKVKIICKEHGAYYQLPYGHLNSMRTGCPKCYNLNKTTEEFIEESIKVHGNLYNYEKTIYEKAKNKLTITCNIHGDFLQAPTHHLQGEGCPICKFSSGELRVLNYLKDNNIKHTMQHSFDGCKNKRLLLFDFYLPDFNTCIEYDGLQHFEAVNFFGGSEGLKKTKMLDGIKDEFCKNNNIRLIRIPYIEMANISNILNFYKLFRYK